MTTIADIVDKLPPSAMPKRCKAVPHGKPGERRLEQTNKVARAICTARCASQGLSPCWSEYTERNDALEWPNPFCADPGCHALAREALDAMGDDLL